jgi:hypothetical protein
LRKIITERLSVTNLEFFTFAGSVEVWSLRCFSYCGSLFSVTFESGSRLPRFKKQAFFRNGWIECDVLLLKQITFFCCIWIRIEIVMNWKEGIPWNWAVWDQSSCMNWGLGWVLLWLLQIIFLDYIWIRVKISTIWKGDLRANALVEMTLPSLVQVVGVMGFSYWRSFWSVTFESG